MDQRPADPGTLHWIEAYLSGSEHPDFQTYTKNMISGTNSAHFMWRINHLVELGRMHRGRVLDIGCGFGWHSVALSMIADAHVVANDIRPLMTSIVDDRVAVIKKQGAPVRVETITSDACHLDLNAESFDAIASNQTIEHVHDLETLFAVCFRLLKRGGAMVITNDNDALGPKSLSQFEAMWKRRDADWDYINELIAQRPVENEGIKPYAVMREEIVRRADDSLSDANVRALVAATAGLLESEIETVAGAYASSRQLPEPPGLSWCQNPVSGEYCERQIDPYDMMEMMRSAGFAPQMRHGFRRWPLTLLNTIAIWSINILMFRLRLFFIIVATKP